MNKEWVYLPNIEFNKKINIKFRGKVYERIYYKRLCGLCESIMFPRVVVREETLQPESQYNHKRRKYCSLSCVNKARYSKRKEYNSVKKSRPIKVILNKKEAVIESYLYNRS